MKSHLIFLYVLYYVLEDLKKDRDNMKNVNHELQMNYSKEMEERMADMKGLMLY